MFSSKTFIFGKKEIAGFYLSENLNHNCIEDFYSFAVTNLGKKLTLSPFKYKNQNLVNKIIFFLDLVFSKFTYNFLVKNRPFKSMKAK
jgi:hypothetical protein